MAVTFQGSEPVLRFAFAVGATFTFVTPALAQAPGTARLELELGAGFPSRNDVRIDGNTGTRFDLNRLQGDPTAVPVRVTLDWQALENHGLRFSYQRLRTEGTGTLSGPTRFRDTVFAPGVATEGFYQFDTWRATYRYTAYRSQTLQLFIGGTLLVRDAEIRLSGAGQRVSRTDLGLVPLLHLAAEWQAAPRLRLIAEVDGLAAPQGYAVDAALRGAFAVTPRWDATLSYRFLDGGADNDRVFNFATFHSVTGGLAYRF